VATFTKLKSGSWRVQVRRKRKYVNNTCLRRKDAEEWALETERRIDRGEPSIGCREARTFGDLVRLHRDDRWNYMPEKRAAMKKMGRLRPRVAEQEAPIRGRETRARRQ
jgi:hypothetical protein